MIAEYSSLEQARLAVLELEQHGTAQRVTIAERRKRAWFPWLSRGRHAGFILVMLGSPAAIAQARDYLHAARSNGQAEPFTGSAVPPSVDELIDVTGAELVSRKRPAVLVARSR